MFVESNVIRVFVESRLRRGVLLALSTVAFLVLASPSAFAQLNASHLLGMTGADDGTQAPPGFWAGGFFYHYSTDSIRTADGSQLVPGSGQNGNLSIPAFAPMLVYVSKGTVLGGHYSAMFLPSIASASIEAPAFQLDKTSSWGAGDSYIVPAQLGWHKTHADAIAMLGIWAPTGRYTAGATNNLGKGMWGWEPAAGATVYLDSAKTWTVATTAFFEMNSKKRGTAVNVGPNSEIALGGVRVGNTLSLEGGLARQFLKGAAHAGAAYYAQWKVTNDNFGIPVTLPNGALLSKSRVFAAGPDLAMPIGTKEKLIAVLNFRYEWEFGAEVKTQGKMFLVSASFPVPSMKLN